MSEIATPAASTSTSPSRSATGAPLDRRFGPFLLKHSLGHSTRSMAWQAVDTRTQQTVWLMMPRKTPGGESELRAWLARAQQAGRVQHPAIGQQLQAEHVAGKPYVVYESRPGWIPLNRHLKEQAWPSLDEAVQWCLDLLGGVAYAHEAGVIHGDLGLHSLAIDGQGRLRIWGWAASTIEVPSSSGSLGSAGYVHEIRHAADFDVGVAGLLLYHWLSRQWALEDSDLPTAMGRLHLDIVRLPWNLPRPVPEALRAIVNRAVHRHGRRRYVSARSFERALDGWRQVQREEHGGALVLLKGRLDTVGHLPALPGIAQRVTQLARMENRRLDALSDVILQDPALSFELLRLVNVRRGAKSLEDPVTTVRRSIALIGLAGVRHSAAALRSWPGPLDLDGSRALYAGMKRAWLAGHIAELLCPGGLDAESALLAAQLHHLGRLLALYHFPSEAVQIRQLMQPYAHPTDGAPVPGLSEDAAAMAVLGVDLDSLAAAMAQHWGLGEAVLAMMQPLPERQPVRSPPSQTGWIRLVASCANEILRARDLPAPKAKLRFERIATRYRQSLDLTVEEIQDIVARAKDLLRGHLTPSKSRSSSSSSDGSETLETA